MSVVEVRQAVSELCGQRGDETIRDYIMAVLELGDYDWGRNGENAYDHFGQMLVRLHSIDLALLACLHALSSFPFQPPFT